MKKPSAYIVDDDIGFTTPLTGMITRFGFTVTVFQTLAEAETALHKNTPDMLLLDIILPDGSGIHLLEHPVVKTISQVIIVTSHSTIDIESNEHDLSAYTLLVKPLSPEILKKVIIKKEPLHTNKDKHHIVKLTLPFAYMVGRSEAMLQNYDIAKHIASTQAPALLLGETGTGKQLIANSIHKLSKRPDHLFFSLNCSSLTHQQLNTLLFGNQQGKEDGDCLPTGSEQGLLERAQGGTLVLQNITAMSRDLQLKLVAVLDTGTVILNSSDISKRISVRFMFTDTNSIKRLKREQLLHSGLLYRLSEYILDMPPLRDRRVDIALLAEYFLVQLNTSNATNKQMTDEAMIALIQYHWPGNVRELRNFIQQMYFTTYNEKINRLALEKGMTTVGLHLDQDTIDLRVGDSIAKAEQLLIIKTMKMTGDNKPEAAKLLGISLKTLYNKLDLYQYRENLR